MHRGRLPRFAATAALVAGTALFAPAPGSATPAYGVFFAGMHNHTGYSDGVPGTTPADAYVKARANGLDIMTVTEHSEAFDAPSTLSEQCLPTAGGTLVECALADGEEPANSLRKWEANLEHARAATKPGFLALRGFEWTSDVFDHLNVYFSSEYTNAKADGGYATMETFWRWFNTHRDALGTFNHPGDKGDSQWNDFAYVPDADARMVGIEVFNGGKSKDYFDRGGVNWIARALDAGWHVGLIGAQDTHTDDWGDGGRYARTGFLAPRLSEAAIRDAMKARRFYATTDANLRLSFTADGRPMGTRLRKVRGAPVALAVSATDPDGESVSSIELFSNGGARVAGPVAGSTASFTVTSRPGEAWYVARVTQADGEKAYSSPVWIGANVHPYGEWLAGDLHVHTHNGHDTCVTPTTKFDGTACDEPWTWSFSPGEQLALAEERGMDYLAITDHNNVVSQSDPAYLANAPGLVLVPAYENSLPGHAQMLGSNHCFGGTKIEVGIEYCTNPDTSDAGVLAQMTALRAEGGVFQINHPGDRDWSTRYGHRIVPDSVEVWNIGTWAYQPPFPAGNDNDFGLAFWEGFLNAGKKVAATGGSDSHWRITSPVQGIGQPTTWIFSSGRTSAGVLQGIRTGRTFVSHQPQLFGGRRLFLEADADRNGTFESMPGDVVPLLTPMRARAEDAPPGAFLRVITRKGRQDILVPPGGLVTIPPSAARWTRVELLLPDARSQRDTCDPLVGGETTYCRNELLVLALTSAIYQTAA